MTTIAVFGTSGSLGAAVLKGLSSKVFSSKISYPIKAITTKDKTKESSDTVKYIQHNLTDKGLIEELKGTDVIISLLPSGMGLVNDLEQVLFKVKPKLYIPSDFGHELQNLDRSLWPAMCFEEETHLKNVRSKGIKTVNIMTSCFKWAPMYLVAFTDHVGINQADGVFTVVGDKMDKLIYFSTDTDIGNSVAAIATTDPAKLEDSYHVVSGSITATDLVKKMEAQHGKTFEVKRISMEEQIEFSKQQTDFLAKLMSEVFTMFSQDLPVHIDNEKINPGESLWKWESEY